MREDPRAGKEISGKGASIGTLGTGERLGLCPIVREGQTPGENAMIRPEVLSKAMNSTGGADIGEDSGRMEALRDRLSAGQPAGWSDSDINRALRDRLSAGQPAGWSDSDIKKRDHATALLFRKERQRTFVTLRSDL